MNVEDVFVVRVFPFPSRVVWFAARGMPEAPALDALAASTQAAHGSAKVVGPDLTSEEWRPLAAWFRRS